MLQPLSPFTDITAHRPEASQCPCQAQNALALPRFDEPAQGGTHILVLALQRVEPVYLLCTKEPWLYLLSQVQEIAGMGLLHPGRFTAFHEAFLAKGMDRLQQQQTWLAARLLALL